MSRVLVTHPSTSHGGQTGIAFGALANSSNNIELLHSASGLCRDITSHKALSYTLKSKNSGTRKVNLIMPLNVVAGSGSSDRNIKSSGTKAPAQGFNESTTTSRRTIQVVQRNNATSATGLLIPFSIVDSDDEDPEEDKYVTDANNVSRNVFDQQLLIQEKEDALLKEKKVDSGEVTVTSTAKSLHTASENSSGEQTSLSSNSVGDSESTLLVDLLDQLEGVRLHALALERWHAPQLKKVHRQYYASARNLLHYVAFRSLDIANLQERLASLGLSSLEGCGAHTLATLNSITSVLRSLLHGYSQANASSCSSNDNTEEVNNSFSSRVPYPSISERHGINFQDGVPTTTDEFGDEDILSFEAGNSMLSHHAELLLGPSPPRRKTTIMVTLPTEAAEDDALVRNLLNSGMNIARINCAHDTPEVWKKMVKKVRFFTQLLNIPCRVSFDLAGPKLRTGPMQPGTSVLKLKPALRDSLGGVITPACVWIAPEGTKPSNEIIPNACVPIIPTSRWTKKIHVGDLVKFRDARGRNREMRVVKKSKGGIFAECRSVAYIESGCEWTVMSGHGGKKKLKVGQLPQVEQAIVLRTGDKLVLKRESMLGRPAQLDELGNVVVPAAVTCTLAKVFDVAKPGEIVKFDDGKIGGVISSLTSSEICVKITEAGDKGRKLRGEKAINFPESDLSIDGLTVKDAADLDFVVGNADMLALSFVNGPADVRALQEELARRRLGDEVGIVVKIETEMGFGRLASILLQAMEGTNPVGVMVARGDMAVECGWERLAELQDQILLVCEAAHVPTVWATQVLEGLAKSGLPSRAEITDAASGSRAECVMLNKGPYVVQAVASLDDILCREACHRRKNQSILHPLQNLHNLKMQGWTR